MNRVINPEILGLISSLKKNYKAVLMNNEGEEWNKFRFEKFHLADIFDEIFTSCIIHESKPNAAYFKAVLEKLKVKPSELIFIDDKQENVESARKIGIIAIHFENPDKLKEGFQRLNARFL